MLINGAKDIANFQWLAAYKSERTTAVHHSILGDKFEWPNVADVKKVQGKALKPVPLRTLRDASGSTGCGTRCRYLQTPQIGS